jgi:sugar lactone lactonase YvrE
LLVDGIVFGEGPRWRGDRLWFSDMHGEAVHTVDLDGRLETVVATPGRRPSGLGFLPDGSLLIVSMLEPEVLRCDGRQLIVHADLRGLALACNDMVVDARGNAYVGSFPPPGQPDGVVVLVRPDGSAEIAADGMLFPNGSVITNEGRTLVVAESMGRRLTRFSIGADGTLSDRSTFAECPPNAPDGICIDAEGAVWVAMPLARRFDRIAPGGEVLDTVSIDDRMGIACTLGGPDMRTLFLLTALHHDPEVLRGTRDATVHTLEVDVPGTGSP